MNDSRTSGSQRFLRLSLIILSILYLILFIYIAVSRINYPYELDWMEGGLLNVSGRVLEGKPVYASPTAEYVPFIYTPLFYIATAGAAAMTKLDFSAARLISLISAILSFLLIFLFVRHDTKSKFWGLISAGLFAAMYEVSGGWMDIGKNDSLNLFILLFAIFIFRFYRSYKSYLFTGILLFLAFFTKQSSIVILLFVLIYSAVYNRRALLPVMLSSIALIAGSTLIMDKIYDGWYTYYIFDLPLKHHLSISYIFLFWSEGIFRICAIPIGFILGNILIDYQGARKSPSWGFNITIGAGMIVTSWILRIHIGSAESAYLPAYAMIVILFGISAGDLLRKLKGNFFANSGKLPAICYLLAVIQFLSLVYNPRLLIPSPSDKNAGDKIVNTIKNLPGDVFVPCHGYLAERAGKKSYAHAMAIYDVLRNNDDEISNGLRNNIRDAYENREFTAVIYDYFDSVLREYDVNGNYAFAEHLDIGNNVFFPVSGERIRPRYLFEPDNNPAFEMMGPMPLVDDN